MDSVLNSANKISSDLVDELDGNLFLVLVIVFSLGYLVCKCILNEGFGINDIENYFHLNGENGDNGGNGANGGPATVGNPEPTIGLEPIPRRPVKVAPSLENQMKLLGAPQQMQKGQEQKAFLKIQEGTIVLPFNEIWNPGYVPVNMVFKGAVSPGQDGYGPLGKDRPLAPTAPSEGPIAPTLQQDKAPGLKNGQAGEATLVLLYAPWCGHSKKMLPDYERVKADYDGQMINNTKMHIVMYNSDVDKDKVKEYGVKGFPTLFYEKDGQKQPFAFRDYDSIVAELKKITG